MNIQRGDVAQSDVIAELIFASEPRLLSFLFGGEIQCKAYLQQACNQAHGQFSANYHWVACAKNKSIKGICAAWFCVMPTAFQQGTISSLRGLLTPQQIIHLVAYKESLDLCFAPPAPHQICIGHVSIEPSSQRKGIATAFIAQVLHDAKENTKRELILDVDTANTGAFECYLKAGFVETKRNRFEATQQTFSRMRLLI
ncbi:MAG: ribosomal protein S18 acetylase RimI-like enzyme [Bermanella sp.]|uniref:GNAT family N-acetyltransferase n=1 Tax=Glaciecola sp. 33A TaxID=2057807 RepID=UPI000C342118|nr:GNAT family N-acetyltransferase [Glaciecola sp. 33A]PKI03289.1 GNAT family N-acetyltransferase [Glaciecola sp. 33A]